MLAKKLYNECQSWITLHCLISLCIKVFSEGEMTEGS